MMAVTPARTPSKEARRRPIALELRGVDMDRRQFELGAYPEPDPTPAWLRPLYLCGCGFMSVRPSSEAFMFHRVPHKCSLRHE